MGQAGPVQLESGETDFQGVWLLVEDSLNTRCERLSFLIFFCIGIFRSNSSTIEILLFRSALTGCFVGYNAYCVLHFVSAIILRNTKEYL